MERDYISLVAHLQNILEVMSDNKGLKNIINYSTSNQRKKSLLWFLAESDSVTPELLMTCTKCILTKQRKVYLKETIVKQNANFTLENVISHNMEITWEWVENPRVGMLKLDFPTKVSEQLLGVEILQIFSVSFNHQCFFVV